MYSSRKAANVALLAMANVVLPRASATAEVVIAGTSVLTAVGTDRGRVGGVVFAPVDVLCMAIGVDIVTSGWRLEEVFEHEKMAASLPWL